MSRLKRGVGFEEFVILIESGEIIDIIQSPSANHPDQSMFVMAYGNYIYAIPFVENDSEIFLKTIMPRRDLKKNLYG